MDDIKTVRSITSIRISQKKVYEYTVKFDN